MPQLENIGARPQRIAALKRLYSWLVNELHILDQTENRAFSLRVPQTRPEQWRHTKVVERAVIMATRRRLDGLWRDRIDVLLGTGWHVTELWRFAREGRIEPRPPRARKGVAGVLSTVHKSGEMNRTQVSSVVLAAAERVRESGSFDTSKLRKALALACKAAGVDRWSPGRMRHTVATWAVQNGDDPAAVAAFLGHKDQRTTRRFYAVHVAPRKVKTPL
jgi:integrase